MAFQSIDELEQFRYDDCVIREMTVEATQIKMTVDALIVGRNNSQNTNFTESYADTAGIRLQGGKIIAAVKDGFKYYDANDVLLKEIPDSPLDEETIRGFSKMCEGAYMYRVDKETDMDVDVDGESCYTFGFEFVDEEESAMGDSYRLTIAFEKAVVSWERYLNRVQA